MNELEVLEEIKQHYRLANKGNGDFVPDWRQEELLGPIENALEKYESEHSLRLKLEDDISELVGEKYVYKKAIDKLSDEIKHLKATNKRNNKKLKALDIIKEKKVNVWAIFMTENADEYNFSIVNEIAKKLTQEEYELLKEVLL